MQAFIHVDATLTFSWEFAEKSTDKMKKSTGKVREI